MTVNGESGAEDLEGGMLEQKVSSSDSSPESVHRGEERKDIRRVCKCVERERVCVCVCLPVWFIEPGTYVYKQKVVYAHKKEIRERQMCVYLCWG